MLKSKQREKRTSNYSVELPALFTLTTLVKKMSQMRILAKLQVLCKRILKCKKEQVTYCKDEVRKLQSEVSRLHKSESCKQISLLPQWNSFVHEICIPQGSCLRPLLFTIYSSKLFQVIQSHLPDIHAYADDSERYISFKPDSKMSQDAALNAMETWMIVNKLKLNDGKTEFMVIGAKQQLSKVNVEHLIVGESRITPVCVAKKLGTWLDSNLSFKEHVNKTCRAAHFHLNNIRCIRKCLSTELTQTLAHASFMGYLIVTWVNYLSPPQSLCSLFHNFKGILH